MDEDVVEARRRGLTAVQLAPLVLGAGALEVRFKPMLVFPSFLFR